MKHLDISKEKAQQIVKKDLHRNKKKVSQHGYNKFYIDAKLEADNESRLNPNLNWKNDHTPRKHKNWFRGI